MSFSIQLPEGFIPFDQISDDNFIPALEKALSQARAQIRSIKTSPASFANTILGLEKAREEVTFTDLVFNNLLIADSNPKRQELAKLFQPKVANFWSEILLDNELFHKVKAVYEGQSHGLSLEDSALLKNTFLEFKLNGALLSENSKIEIRRIDERLAELSPLVQENVLNHVRDFQIHIRNEDELDGLPSNLIHTLREEARAKNLDGFIITLNSSVVSPILKLARRRSLREQVYRSYHSRAFGGKYDNQKLILEMAQLRQRRARLLGYESYAESIMEQRMAGSEESALALLQDLASRARPAAERDLHDVSQFAKSQGHTDPVMPWDFEFFAEGLKKRRFNLDDEQLRPYFPLEQVQAGVFTLIEQLFGLQFKPTKAPLYHPDVTAYKVSRKVTGEAVGLLYLDLFPRASKSEGAWMTNFLDQGLFRSQMVRPVVSIVCNFAKPAPNQPALLSMTEVRTLFHELGHGLHGLLSQVCYQSLAGTHVYHDFVELPSQLLENWALEKSVLHQLSRHHETGEPLPDAWVEQIKASDRFLSGYYTMRQVNFAMLDMAWFGRRGAKKLLDEEAEVSVPEFEREATQSTRILPRVDGTNISSAFTHIFGGMYAGGYYSYKWAEVLDADAFDYFLEKGLLNRSLAESFETHILSKGGSEHPMTLYKRFRGREPSLEPLLRRDGLLP